MKNRWLAVAVILGVLAVLIAAPFVSEFLAADDCVDSGGSFDYTTNACDHQTNHPFIPYSQRHPYSLAMFSGVAVVFVVAVIASFKR